MMNNLLTRLQSFTIEMSNMIFAATQVTDGTTKKQWVRPLCNPLFNKEWFMYIQDEHDVAELFPIEELSADLIVHTEVLGTQFKPFKGNDLEQVMTRAMLNDCLTESTMVAKGFVGGDNEDRKKFGIMGDVKKRIFVGQAGLAQTKLRLIMFMRNTNLRNKQQVVFALVVLNNTADANGSFPAPLVSLYHLENFKPEDKPNAVFFAKRFIFSNSVMEEMYQLAISGNEADGVRRDELGVIMNTPETRNIIYRAIGHTASYHNSLQFPGTLRWARFPAEKKRNSSLVTHLFSAVSKWYMNIVLLPKGITNVVKEMLEGAEVDVTQDILDNFIPLLEANVDARRLGKERLFNEEKKYKSIQHEEGISREKWLKLPEAYREFFTCNDTTPNQEDLTAHGGPPLVVGIELDEEIENASHDSDFGPRYDVNVQKMYEERYRALNAAYQYNVEIPLGKRRAAAVEKKTPTTGGRTVPSRARNN